MKLNKKVIRSVIASAWRMVWSWRVICFIFASICANASIPSVKPLNRSAMQVLSPPSAPVVTSPKFSENDKALGDFREQEQRVYEALRQLRDHVDPSMIQAPKQPDWSGYARDYPAIPASTRTRMR